MKKVLLISMIACACIACKDIQTIDKDNYRLVIQPYGPTLGYSPESGVQIIQKHGKAYKDLDRDGKISVYEDWRKSNEKRAEDLAQRLSIEEIAGLMLYSDHQAVPATSYDISTYGGKPYRESGADPWELTDHQKQFLKDDHLRHMLVTIIESPEVAAKWSNRVQAYVEGLGHGIPANNSSDPRHSSRADGEYNAGGGGKISQWPGTLGLAATFSPELVERFGEIASTEYRALGFTTALSPQVDLGTEPRWQRYSGTFGEDPDLATDMARAYCDGFQKSDKDKSTYVNAMVKHWPGGGCGEAGRDAHYGFGKYAVYPGGNFELHKKPFVEGAFRLHGESKCVAAVMPYYTVSVGQGDELVGNSYNREIITHQLREQAGFEGVVCTDWMVTDDEHHTGIHYGKPWGVEHLSLGERHYKALMAGVDQFGGNYDKEPVLEAYQMGVNEVGKDSMDRRMRQSAKRLLLNFFR
ncbi:MAG: glycoside hydrolase family 3 protein, partial [Paludibacteraceae bacterium]|nr:glycoside hydrolase family 3 protein [Paludibacteraceae bacterium]